jgi:hypothetical protein
MLPDHSVIIIEQFDQILLYAEVLRLHPAGYRPIWLHDSDTSVPRSWTLQRRCTTTTTRRAEPQALISDPREARLQPKCSGLGEGRSCPVSPATAGPPISHFRLAAALPARWRPAIRRSQVIVVGPNVREPQGIT